VNFVSESKVKRENYIFEKERFKDYYW